MTPLVLSPKNVAVSQLSGVKYSKYAKYFAPSEIVLVDRIHDLGLLDEMLTM